MKYIDLHTHSACSDGTFTPSELAAYAAEKGLAAFALTDHDTTDGLAEAACAAAEHGIEFVPGIEFSTNYNGHDIHIVGLDIDPEQEDLAAKLQSFRANRDTRNEEMLSLLRRIGGFDIMTNWLINQVNLPIFWFIVIMTLICAGLYGISGSFVLSTYAVTPVVAGAVMSNHPELAMFAFCCLAIAAPMFGSCITPISNGILFSSGFLKVPVTKIIRRGAVAGAAGMLMVIVASFIIYA